MKTYFQFTDLLGEQQETLLKYQNYIVDGKNDGKDIPNLKETFYVERTDLTVIVLNEETDASKHSDSDGE